MKQAHLKRVELRIVSDYNETPDEIVPGCEVIEIVLIYRGRRYWIPWGPTHLILIDFLCRNRFRARDTVWIADHMQLDPYVVYSGANAPGHRGRPARTTRTAVRKQIQRIRETLAELIADEGLDLDAWEIIRSEESSTNVVRYRIWADVSWEQWRPPESDGGNGLAMDPRIPHVHPGLLGAQIPGPLEARW